MTDIDPIRRRHNDFVSSHPCSTDTCDTRVVLDALDSSRKAHRDAHEMASWYEDRERAAHADADRLAEALRAHWNARCEEWDDRDSEALRLHDKAAEVVA